ncbi:MAG: PKD domain-containing protein [Bacteroidetes bacterium]|nr:PKD domain-containing protein [Bacteroidota bacterium]
MKKIIPAIFLFLFIDHVASGQCPVAGFTTSGSTCAGQPINLANTSSGSGPMSYSWDFCIGDFNTLPTAADEPLSSGGPTSMNVVFDGTDWYGFALDINTHILRFDFGSSLSNPPTGPTDLGNPGGLIVGGTLFNKISFLQQAGNWYGVFGVNKGYQIITLDFGSSLANATPTPSSFTDPAIPAFLVFQDLKIDNDSIFLVVGNDNSGQILMISYGTSILNTPTATAISLPGYSNMEEVALVKSCNQWMGYGVSYSSNTLVKFDFGSSLSNAPTLTDLGNPGGFFSHPYSIVLDNDGMQWVAFVQNYVGSIYKVNMGSSIINPVLSASPVSLPGINGMGTSITMVKENSSYYLFPSGYSAGKWAKIKYESPCNAVPATSSDSLPASAAYSSAGTYYFSLSATDIAGNTDHHFDSVTINYAPVSNFSITNSCLGDVSIFIDSSTISNPGTITSYHWDFGDASTDNSQNTSHTYATAGTYLVSLTTTANNGCSNTKTVTLNITPKPVALLSVPPSCSLTPIQFSDLSTIASGAITGWHWDFGNTQTDTIQNPVYSYPTGGSYLISLLVTSDAGCTGSTTFLLDISFRPHSGFDATNTCVGQSVQFVDLTTSPSPIQNYSWDFGDSFTDTIANPSHTYASVVTTYSVSFIVTALNGCVDTTTREIKINNIPSASFNYAPLNVCEGNNVAFTDLSSVSGDTISGWLWNFGDATTDTVQNPVHQYSTPGNYTVTLIAYSPTSCGNSTTQNLSVIQSPDAAFGSVNVCLDSAMQFIDQSTTPSGSFAASWFWDFGDATNDTLQNPTHVFQSSGDHLVKLTVTSNFGCTNTDSAIVTIHPKPASSFVNGIPCTINNVQFNNTTTIDTPSTIISYQWNFGNPTSGSNSSILANPIHLYDTTGNFVVSLITTSDFGCMDTAFTVLSVLQASHADFQYAPTCYGDLVHLVNLSSPFGLDSAWAWNFDDNTGLNPLENPSHFYAFPQTYHVTLTVYASTGCVTSVTKPVTVSPIPTAAFVHSPACINTTYHFLDSSYVASGSIIAWKWNFAGLDSSNLQNPVFTFPDTGSYLIRLTVTSDIGCKNTLTRLIHVYPLPVANFSFSPQYGNPPLTVSFTNLTSGGSTYQWNFGDSSAISTQTNPQHLYTDTNLFAIQLIAVSQYGCKDTIEKSIYVIKPVLDLAVTNASFTVQDNHLQVTVDLANLGTRSIHNFKIEAHIEGGTAIQESYVQTLNNGYSGQLLLFSKLDLGSGQARYFCVSAVDPNGSTDDVPTNNEVCKSLTKEFSVVNPYPNPFNDQVMIQLVLPYKDQLSVELIDMNGKSIPVFAGEGHEGLNQIAVDLGSLANAAYALRIRFRESEVIKTIVKMKKK